MQDFLSQFDFIKSKYDDGSGFWDEYKKKGKWLDQIIEISIAARNISDDIPPLLQNFMDHQADWDKEFKRFAGERLLSDLKKEWDNDLLTIEDVMKRINVSDITFGFENKENFGIWFVTGGEHGVQIYGDNQGRFMRAAIE